MRLSPQHPALATCTHHSGADGRGRPSQQRSIHSICPQLKPDALPSAPGEGQTPLRTVCTAVAAAALATEGRRPQRYPYHVSAITVQGVASLRPSYLQKQKQDQDESKTSMTTGHPSAPAALHPQSFALLPLSRDITALNEGRKGWGQVRGRTLGCITSVKVPTHLQAPASASSCGILNLPTHCKRERGVQRRQRCRPCGLGLHAALGGTLLRGRAGRKAAVAGLRAFCSNWFGWRQDSSPAVWLFSDAGVTHHTQRS